MGTLTESEQFTLNHWSMYGSGGYPITKVGRLWFVENCPKPFKTKREAVSQWENYISLLIDRKAGRI